MKDRIFGVLQRIGRSFMLPIALLPVAGLLLGIGSSFTNPTTLETYGLTGVIHEGGVLYTIFDIMSKTGSVVFDNLALLFAMGVAIGMAKKEKAARRQCRRTLLPRYWASPRFKWEFSAALSWGLA